MATNNSGGGDAPDDYVGYKHPPKKHRFGKNNNANPHGRKGKPRTHSDFLDERQRLLVDGKWRWLTRDQLIDHALYKAAVADGNVSAAKLLDARRQARLGRRAASADDDALAPDEQAALLRAAARAFRKRETGGADSDAGEEDEP